jgi:hypothetical protein
MAVSELSLGCVRNTVQGKSSDRVASSLPLVSRYYYDIIIYSNMHICDMYILCKMQGNEIPQIYLSHCSLKLG